MTCQTPRDSDPFPTAAELRDEMRQEIKRLGQALEDAAGKAELAVRMVENPDVAAGFRVIAEHCREAISPRRGGRS